MAAAGVGYLTPVRCVARSMPDQIREAEIAKREELADPHSCRAGEGDVRCAASARVEDQRAEQCTTIQKISDQQTALTRSIRKSPHASSWSIAMYSSG